MYELERAEGARTALFTFGSFTNPGRTEPSYAFVNTILRMRRTRGIVCDAYYFKAKANDWYLSGFNGSDSFEHSVAELSQLVAGYDRVVFMGNSMGGFAALAFGLKLNTGLILAFSPQTRFDQKFCAEIGEKRWKLEFEQMRRDHAVEKMAVSSLWPEPCAAKAHLFVGGSCSQDLAYLADLGLRPGLQSTVFEESGHDLVHDLRSSGQLEEIIYGTLNLPESAEVPGE